MPNLKDRFRDGEILVGTWLNGPVASQVEIIGGAGFDFVILDSEHSSYGLDQCEDLVRAADAVTLPCLVRVAPGDAREVGKALDFGAQGIIVPHVSSDEEARACVRYAHFAPLGARGAAPTVRGARFGRTAWKDYLAQATSETMVVLQIEGQEGIDQLDRIMSVEGVDVLFVGTFDLSESLGVSGQLDHPKLLDAVAHIVRRAREKEIALGLWMPKPEQVGPWIERGVQMITVANNDMIFFEACRAVAEAVKARIADRSAS
jgi:4-hydroxy-2-oxoheptanedioate aldolase